MNIHDGKYFFISIDSSHTYSEIMITIMLNNKEKNIPARGRDIRCSGLFCECISVSLIHYQVYIREHHVGLMDDQRAESVFPSRY